MLTVSPDVIFATGVVICAACGLFAAAAAVVLRLYKKRLDSRLDAEYGKRRRVKK